MPTEVPHGSSSSWVKTKMLFSIENDIDKSQSRLVQSWERVQNTTGRSQYSTVIYTTCRLTTGTAHSCTNNTQGPISICPHGNTNTFWSNLMNKSHRISGIESIECTRRTLALHAIFAESPHKGMWKRLKPNNLRGPKQATQS